MSQETLERTMEDGKTLTPQEQQQRLLEYLLKTGVIANIPSGLYHEEARDFHDPIDVTGRPVSELLLADRG